ncbi:hypothetical protein DFP72DRAFT_31770 [Ephemerocybe angulata]|uniref:BTB domain-containing protein n=1 Tax=Ephemerocybe angulata TaxID=980116 RepID=A0A8H6MAH2_9AGAR|nr:hypothetical protein DFP72DRAFT_31770 [Tulosesus angulatus]
MALSVAETTDPAIVKDAVYFWENVSFLAGGILFRVPRHPFIQGSPHFAKELGASANPGFDSGELDCEWERIQGSAESIVTLEDVGAEDFRTFLKVIFPIHSKSISLHLTKEEWIAVLRLSTRWEFVDIRKLAIQQLDPELSDPIELISVGRLTYVVRWVLAGFAALVERPEIISEAESEEIGPRSAIRLYIIRHRVAIGLTEGGAAGIEPELQLRFGDEIRAMRDKETQMLQEQEAMAALESRTAVLQAQERQMSLELEGGQVRMQDMEEGYRDLVSRIERGFHETKSDGRRRKRLAKEIPALAAKQDVLREQIQSICEERARLSVRIA